MGNLSKTEKGFPRQRSNQGDNTITPRESEERKVRVRGSSEHRLTVSTTSFRISGEMPSFSGL